MKSVAERWLSRAGYTVIPTWRVHRHAQASYLRRLFAFAHVGCVIDVGANDGQYRDFLRTDVGFEGWIVSFEPTPHLAEGLRERARHEKKWIVEPCALGAEAGRASFRIMKDTQFNSFLEPDHGRTALFDDSNDVATRIEVPVDTLDAAIARHRHTLGHVPMYLKIDTQGFDIQVLRGASNVLRDTVALQSEMSVTPIYQGAPAYHDAMELIRALGFEVSAMFPNNAGHFPVLIEFDCHFVARALCQGVLR
jgi:FkbM family methyltransferase